MALQILDGKGRGFLAEVDSDNHLQVIAITQSELEHVSEEFGLAFSISNDTYDYTAADTILLVKNTSTDKTFHVASVCCSGDAAGEVIIHVPTSEVVTPTGTAITARNLNTGSGKVAELTAIRDETSNAQGDIYAAFRMAANDPHTTRFDGSLILGTNESVGVDFVAEGAAANVTILGFFE